MISHEVTRNMTVKFTTKIVESFLCHNM